MERDVRVIDLLDEFLVLETFDSVDGNHDFAMLGNEFFHNVHAFAKELAFAFAALFGSKGQKLAEPGRIGHGVGALFGLNRACFQRCLVDILVNEFGLLFGALAVNRRLRIPAKTAGFAVATAATKAAPAPTEGLVAKTARAAFPVEPGFAFATAAIFTESMDTAGAIATERAFARDSVFTGIVAAGATFVSLFAHSELAVQSHFHCALLFFAHNFSINCFATDSPSIFNSLYRPGISPCSTKWSGRPKRNIFLSV